MSGRPMTEYWTLSSDNYMPYNRGNLGRTPFAVIANLYAEYSLRLGKTALNFNINVDNLFNIKTAQDINDWRTFWSLIVSDEKLISGNWDLDDPEVGYIPDPGWMMKYQFYPPIAVRLGMKFIF